MNIKDFDYQIPVHEALSWKLNGTTLGTTLGALAFDDAIANDVESNGKVLSKLFVKPEITVITPKDPQMDFFKVTLVEYVPEAEEPLTATEQHRVLEALNDGPDEDHAAVGCSVGDDDDRMQEAGELWDTAGGWNLQWN